MSFNLYRVPGCEIEISTVKNNCIVDNALFLNSNNINNMKRRLKEGGSYVSELERPGVCEMRELRKMFERDISESIVCSISIYQLSEQRLKLLWKI